MKKLILMEWKNDEHGARYTEKGEVVSCKDCKFWQEPVEQDGYKYPSQCTRDERAYMEECAILMDADDFCSRGVKRWE